MIDGTPTPAPDENSRATSLGQTDRLREAIAQGPAGTPLPADGMIGNTPAMHEVHKMVRLVAPLSTAVLLTGESGTGKDLVARAIHLQSPRASRPYVVLNCAAIPENVIESELFGHERGAFTDAHGRKVGQLELADGGTLVLDEIGEMPLALQARLLRVLEQRQVLRVGGTQAIGVDVRVVASTNRDLEGAVHAGTFRADLYYRLNVVRIHLPPLRERRDDIPPLVTHFVARKWRNAARPAPGFTADAMEYLVRHAWPGNVRELENAVERVLALAESDPIRVEDLPREVRVGCVRLPSARDEVLSGRRSLQSAVDEFERDILLEALRRTGFNQTQTARLLGTTRRILRYRMRKLAIEPERAAPGDSTVA